MKVCNDNYNYNGTMFITIATEHYLNWAFWSAQYERTM